MFLFCIQYYTAEVKIEVNIKDGREAGVEMGVYSWYTFCACFRLLSATILYNNNKKNIQKC